MARKELSDFNYDYHAYANYLESAECSNDDGYDAIADQYGNVYTPTEGDWNKGHGHKNENTNYDRKSEDRDFYGRGWKNPWLKYIKKLNLTEEEINFLDLSCNNNQTTQSKEIDKKYILLKRK